MKVISTTTSFRLCRNRFGNSDLWRLIIKYPEFQALLPLFYKLYHKLSLEILTLCLISELLKLFLLSVEACPKCQSHTKIFEVKQCKLSVQKT